jgi:hypothetical protein
MSKGVRIGLLAVVALGLSGVGCTPGYMTAKNLESRGQGPAACEKSCADLGMRMAALVLVGNELPGCVCQPLHVQGAPLEAPKPSAESDSGAAASTTGYVVLAAAAAARQQQEQQRRNAQSSQKP